MTPRIRAALVAPTLSLRVTLPLALLAAHAAPGIAQSPQDPPASPVPTVADPTSLDLEDLLEIRVITAAKREQVVTRVPAAIHVVRGEELARAGVRSIPEALRLVPGVHVARTRANTWAISARGFNDNLSNKLLVTIDGRSVYSPLHSGVFWDVQDTFVEDIDRIEVIRGPGGSLWGANAINGIINVITKPASATLGGKLVAGGGTEERAFTSARYGVALDDDAHLRVYAKYTRRDDAADGVDRDRDAYDGADSGRGGFRADWGPANDRLTLMGDAYEGRIRQRVAAPSLTSPTGADLVTDRVDVHGGHLLGRWEHTFAGGSSVAAQAYYDFTERDDALFRDAVHTADLDVTYRLAPDGAHDVNFGVGYRVQRIDVRNTFAFQITPDERTDGVATAFLQDEVTLVPDTLRVTAGCKLEHNDYSDFEVQPSLRLAWEVDERQTAWAAVTRAVRTPSIVDVDARLTPIVAPGPVPVVFSIFGDDDFRSEELLAYEAGYCVQLADAVSLDVAAFYNDYDHLRGGTPGTPFVEPTPVPNLVIPIQLGNNVEAESHGAELAVNVQPGQDWLLQAHYGYLELDVSEPAGEGRDPRHIAMLRSSLQPVPGLSLDTTVRYVSELPAFGVDEYVEVGVRLAWRDAERGFEAALVGHDLVHEEHAEFGAAGERSEIQRGVFFVLTWTF